MPCEYHVVKKEWLGKVRSSSPPPRRQLRRRRELVVSRTRPASRPPRIAGLAQRRQPALSRGRCRPQQPPHRPPGRDAAAAARARSWRGAASAGASAAVNAASCLTSAAAALLHRRRLPTAMGRSPSPTSGASTPSLRTRRRRRGGACCACPATVSRRPRRRAVHTARLLVASQATGLHTRAARLSAASSAGARRWSSPPLAQPGVPSPTLASAVPRLCRPRHQRRVSDRPAAAPPRHEHVCAHGGGGGAQGGAFGCAWAAAAGAAAVGQRRRHVLVAATAAAGPSSPLAQPCAGGGRPHASACLTPRPSLTPRRRSPAPRPCAEPTWAGTLFAPSNCAWKYLLADLDVTEKLLLSNQALLDEVLAVSVARRPRPLSPGPPPLRGRATGAGAAPAPARARAACPTRLTRWPSPPARPPPAAQYHILDGPVMGSRELAAAGGQELETLLKQPLQVRWRALLVRWAVGWAGAGAPCPARRVQSSEAALRCSIAAANTGLAPPPLPARPAAGAGHAAGAVQAPAPRAADRHRPGDTHRAAGPARRRSDSARPERGGAAGARASARGLHGTAAPVARPATRRRRGAAAAAREA